MPQSSRSNCNLWPLSGRWLRYFLWPLGLLAAAALLITSGVRSGHSYCERCGLERRETGLVFAFVGRIETTTPHETQYSRRYRRWVSRNCAHVWRVGLGSKWSWFGLGCELGREPPAFQDGDSNNPVHSSQEVSGDELTALDRIRDPAIARTALLAAGSPGDPERREFKLGDAFAELDTVTSAADEMGWWLRHRAMLKQMASRNPGGPPAKPEGAADRMGR